MARQINRVALFAAVGMDTTMPKMALAVACGGAVIGRECAQGAALYLALEDNKRRLQRRLKKIEPHFPWPSDLELHTEWPRLDAGGLDAIRQWIRTRPNARLVIVDTLAVVRPQQKSTDSTYSGDYAALRGLHQIASKNNMAVMVVHHLRKADAEEVPGHPQRSAVLMVDYCA